MVCPCLPCPWCILEVAHDSELQECQEKVRTLMVQWQANGCSGFQIALTVFAFEWILKFHHHQVYRPNAEAIDVAAAPGYTVASMATHLQRLSATVVLWTEAPPPPPGLPEVASSSSAASTVTSTMPSRAGWTPKRSVVSGSHSQGSAEPWSAVTGTAMLPEVEHPNFQWQAASAKGKKDWRSYEEPYQSRLKQAYFCAASSYNIVWDDDDDHPDTVIDFQSMVQINTVTGYERAIRIKPRE
jgi:hypothetical protein